MAKTEQGQERARKISEAIQIVSAIGIPVKTMTRRRRERIALALLAAANLKPGTPWSDAACWEGTGSRSLSTREMIEFWNEHYGENLSRGSYDDVRRRDLVYLVHSNLVVQSAGNPEASTNDPQRRESTSAFSKIAKHCASGCLR